MYHLRVPVFLLAALVLLRCIAAAPSHRYFSLGSSDDEQQENGLPDKQSRSLPELISNPFLGSRVARSKLGFTQMSSVRLQIKKKLQEKDAQTKKARKKSTGKKDKHQPPTQPPTQLSCTNLENTPVT